MRRMEDCSSFKTGTCPCTKRCLDESDPINLWTLTKIAGVLFVLSVIFAAVFT